MVLTDINTLRLCKNIAGLTVSVGAEIKETAETLRTDLLTFFVELKCWYGGAIMTFTASGAGVWKAIVEALTKTNLWTLWILKQALNHGLILKKGL